MVHFYSAVYTMPTISKKHLISKVAEKTNNPATPTTSVVQHFLNEITVELGKNNRLEFRDFGVFEVRQRKARVAQNPKTMEKVVVPAKNVVKFKVGRAMKENLNRVVNVE